MRPDPRLIDRATGFTLLETLAAVAVLALVYVTLARVGIVALRAEGAADRRLRAALVADRRLLELEAQMISGETVPLGDRDEEVGDLRLHVSVEPFDLTLPPPPEAAAKRLRGAKGAADAARAAAGEASGASLFAPVAAGQPGPSRRVTVRVGWTDGSTEEEVIRETYGLDRAAAAPLLEALQAASAAARQREENVDGSPQSSGDPGQSAPRPTGTGEALPFRGGEP